MFSSRLFAAAAVTPMTAVAVAGCGGSSAPSPQKRALSAAGSKFNAAMKAATPKLVADASAKNYSALQSDYAPISNANTDWYLAVKKIHFPAKLESKRTAFISAESVADGDLLNIEGANSASELVQGMARFRQDHKRAVAAFNKLLAAA